MLRNIYSTCCPICGNSVITAESVDSDERGIREHANRGRWEHRTFGCGQKVSYIPNFSREELSTGYYCKNDPKLKARRLAEKKFYQNVLDFISKSENTEGLEESFVNHYKYNLEMKLNTYHDVKEEV